MAGQNSHLPTAVIVALYHAAVEVGNTARADAYKRTVNARNRREQAQAKACDWRSERARCK